MHRIAVIADPHYHEIFPGYPGEGVAFGGRSGAFLRTLADSAASTRIFNESYLALPAALDACAAEGIRTVLIVGDLTDDGQIATMDSALALLERYERRHAMRFLLTPGNHDVYGMSGRHHVKAFLASDGSTVSVASDPAYRGHGTERIVTDSRMFCPGYGRILPLWARHGLMRRMDDLHWESPFGPDDMPEARMFEMRSPDGRTVHRQPDASYLVEPEPGLWVLSIDANVFEPRNGRPDNTDPEAFEDSTGAGWNALVRLKPFILEWMADVARRARAEGKTLICFSHYPAIDPLRETAPEEAILLGVTEAVRRAPLPDTARAVCETGIGVHFSGHLHVNHVNRLEHAGQSLTNIAVPSLVAFPPAYCTVTADRNHIEVTTRLLSVPGYDAFFPFYRTEADRSGRDAAWLDARSYPDFLYGHVRELVLRRYVPREWPADLAAFLERRSIEDLFVLAGNPAPVFAEQADMLLPCGLGNDMTIPDLVTDWYAARKAGALARAFIPSSRLETYGALASLYAVGRWDDPGCLQARMAVFFSVLARHLDLGADVPAAAQ